MREMHRHMFHRLRSGEDGVDECWAIDRDFGNRKGRAEKSLLFQCNGSISKCREYLVCLRGLFFEPLDLAGESAQALDERKESLVTESQCGEAKLGLKFSGSKLFDSGLAHARVNPQ